MLQKTVWKSINKGLTKSGNVGKGSNEEYLIALFT